MSVFRTFRSTSLQYFSEIPVALHTNTRTSDLLIRSTEEQNVGQETMHESKPCPNSLELLEFPFFDFTESHTSLPVFLNQPISLLELFSALVESWELLFLYLLAEGLCVTQRFLQLLLLQLLLLRHCFLLSPVKRSTAATEKHWISTFGWRRKKRARLTYFSTLSSTAFSRLASIIRQRSLFLTCSKRAAFRVACSRAFFAASSLCFILHCLSLISWFLRARISSFKIIFKSVFQRDAFWHLKLRGAGRSPTHLLSLMVFGSFLLGPQTSNLHLFLLLDSFLFCFVLCLPLLLWCGDVRMMKQETSTAEENNGRPEHTHTHTHIIAPQKRIFLKSRRSATQTPNPIFVQDPGLEKPAQNVLLQRRGWEQPRGGQRNVELWWLKRVSWGRRAIPSTPWKDVVPNEEPWAVTTSSSIPEQERV